MPPTLKSGDQANFEGLVIRTESGFHRILLDNKVVVCRTPKKLLSGERTNTTPVVIGDRARVREQGDGTGVITEILPRSNELVRGAAGGSRYLDVIAANLDLLVVVHSLKEPEFNPARLDRLLILSEAAEIRALICLNKLDLSNAMEAEETATIYRNAGYRVIFTCAKSGLGIDELRDEIRARISALVGPSGVGKSSLLNRIQPGLKLRTEEVSGATGKGRHTTTTAELLGLVNGGWVADTPGLRELAIREVEPQEVEWFFPEFRPFLTSCKFTNCSHRGEFDCAVRCAVEEGDISAGRYESYRKVYEDVLEQQAF